jgi:hypothetical protein
MTSPLSFLGVVHTAISLVPVVAGLYSFARYDSIEPATRSGRVYLAGLALSVFTASGLSITGGFNPGHAVGILALLTAYGSCASAPIPAGAVAAVPGNVRTKFQLLPAARSWHCRNANPLVGSASIG